MLTFPRACLCPSLSSFPAPNSSLLLSPPSSFQLHLRECIIHALPAPPLPAPDQPACILVLPHLSLMPSGSLSPAAALRSGGKASVVVVVDATRDLTLGALEWALSHVVQPGDDFTLLGILHQVINPMGYKSKADLSAFNGVNSKMLEDEVSRKFDLYQDTLRKSQRLCDKKGVRLEIRVTAGTPLKVITVQETAALQATWVVLDRHLKKDKKYYSEQISSNLVLMKRSGGYDILRICKQPIGANGQSVEEQSVGTRQMSDALVPVVGAGKGYEPPGSGMPPNLPHASSVATAAASLSPDFTAGSCFSINFEESSAAPHIENFHSVFDDPEISQDSRMTGVEQSETYFDLSGTEFFNEPKVQLWLNESIKSSDGSYSGHDEDAARGPPPKDMYINNRVPDMEPMTEAFSTVSISSGAPSLFETDLAMSVASKNSLLHPAPISVQPINRTQVQRLHDLLNQPQTDRMEYGPPKLTADVGYQQIENLVHATNNMTERELAQMKNINAGGLRQGLMTRMEQYRELGGNRPGSWPADREEMQKMSAGRTAITLKKPSLGPPPLCSVCNNVSPKFGQPPRKFTYAELEEATDNFSADHYLAEGGFGFVYRGTLNDGQQIAVKQHKLASSQGDVEFCSEVEVLSCAQHRNLVTLIGYCVENRRRLLVYEYVCNGSLDYHLSARNPNILEWRYRSKIAIGAARGLRYLHEEVRVGCIVHRDLRPNNILLTHDFTPLVGDFGLARWQPDGDLAVETRVIGTLGYLAPEYAETGQITDKADVYSFGVVLLELITGRKAIDPNRPKGQQCLTEWARPLLEERATQELLDPRLERSYDDYELYCMVHAASQCIRKEPAMRPRMSQVLRLLEGDKESGSSSPSFNRSYNDFDLSYSRSGIDSPYAMGGRRFSELPIPYTYPYARGKSPDERIGSPMGKHLPSHKGRLSYEDMLS